MEEKKVAEQKPQVPVQARSKKWIFGLVGGVLLVFFALVIFLPQPYYTEGFKTLSELQEYAKTIDENIKMENDNYFFPSYESYYKKTFGPSWWLTIKEKITGLLYHFGLIHRPLFSPSFFKTLLLDVTQERQRKGWVGEFVQKIEIQPDSKVIVFGAVQGAFHPLVRYLEKLKELEIIDENLVLKNPNDYMVFLGNVVNRSPYTLEIFSIVLRLLKQNPEKVIYLKNTNEFPEYWRQHSLRRELSVRARWLSAEEIPLAHEVDSFFSTLPLTLFNVIHFLSSSKLNYFKTKPVIQDPIIASKLNDKFYINFISKKTNGIDFQNLAFVQNESSNQEIFLRAVITDIRKKIEYEEMVGLRLLSPQEGATAWTILSSTADSYRTFLKFFYDAFVIIIPSNDVNNWAIRLYNRDIRGDRTFKETNYNFFSGQII